MSMFITSGSASPLQTIFKIHLLYIFKFAYRRRKKPRAGSAEYAEVHIRLHAHYISALSFHLPLIIPHNAPEL